MGFFSENCHTCNKSILNPYSINEINKWMAEVVVITQNDSIIKGTYDGYGRVIVGATDVDGLIGYNQNSVWHRACWELDGCPTTFQGACTSAEDQGYFFDDGKYDIPDPRAMSQLLVDLYDKGGQSAVYDYVLKNYPTWRWGWCEGCDCDSPAMPDDGLCAVCWGYPITASI